MATKTMGYSAQVGLEEHYTSCCSPKTHGYKIMWSPTQASTRPGLGHGEHAAVIFENFVSGSDRAFEVMNSWKCLHGGMHAQVSHWAHSTSCDNLSKQLGNELPFLTRHYPCNRLN